MKNVLAAGLKLASRLGVLEGIVRAERALAAANPHLASWHVRSAQSFATPSIRGTARSARMPSRAAADRPVPNFENVSADSENRLIVSTAREGLHAAPAVVPQTTPNASRPSTPDRPAPNGAKNRLQVTMLKRPAEFKGDAAAGAPKSSGSSTTGSGPWSRGLEAHRPVKEGAKNRSASGGRDTLSVAPWKASNTQPGTAAPGVTDTSVPRRTSPAEPASRSRFGASSARRLEPPEFPSSAGVPIPAAPRSQRASVAAGNALSTDTRQDSVGPGKLPPAPILQSPDEPGAASAADRGPLQGDVYLDGTLMGRWLARHLTDAAARPANGSASFDPRRNAFPTGAMIGS